ncbi:hypothetical protein [Nonomuraea glycinis]|uniref:hypothetical protein n=1 Tax=Nonomuraea glycinis TaxID=2047744 RepID=UPI0033ACE434
MSADPGIVIIGAPSPAAPVGEGEPGVLSVDRRIESEDGSRDEVLVSAIVTVLDGDGELLMVRDATEAEAGRVLAVERVWQ